MTDDDFDPSTARLTGPFAQGDDGFDPSTAKLAPAPGFIPTVKRTAGQMLTTAATTAEDVIGSNAVTGAVKETGQGIIDRNPAGIRSLADVVDSPWLTVKESVGQFAPQIAAAAAGGLAGAKAGAVLGSLAGPAGAALGGTIGGAAGSLLPIFTQEYGGIRQEQQESGQEDKGRALVAAIPATALERVGMGKALKVLKGVPGPGGILKEAGKGVLKEGATEGAQNVIEQVGAFKDPTTGENLQDTALSAVMGGIGGGVVGAGSGAVDGSRQRARQRADAEGRQRAQEAIDSANALAEEARQADPTNAWTTEAGAAAPVTDPVTGVASEANAPGIDATQFSTSPGAAGESDGLDFKRDVDTSGLSLQDPAEVERARAATVDYEPGDATPQWDTEKGAAPARQGLDMPAPPFDTGDLSLDMRTPSQRMGIDPAAGPLSKAATMAVDSGAHAQMLGQQAQQAQFLGATGRDIAPRRTGPGLSDDSNVIDVQGRVIDEPAIGTPRRLTTQESAQEFGAQAFLDGVPRAEIVAIPNVVHRASQLRGYDEAARQASTPALPAPRNVRDGLERIRAQRQLAAQAAQSTHANPTGAVPHGPQADQAQQGGTQQPQARNQEAAGRAAAPAGAAAPNGGSGVQADGLNRPQNWRTSMLRAGPVARAMGLQTKGKRLAQMVAEIDAADARRAGAPQDGTDLSAGRLNRAWSVFAPETGSLGVPRDQMPQIKAEHRGALVNFLKARGIDSRAEEVPANDLKPTQAEFSPAKVEKARAFKGGDRSILVSSDGYVVDGHHQWLAKRANGEPVKVIRLKAPIQQVLAQVAEFPSTTAAPGTNQDMRSAALAAGERKNGAYPQQASVRTPNGHWQPAVTAEGGALKAIDGAPQFAMPGAAARWGQLEQLKSRPGADIQAQPVHQEGRQVPEAATPAVVSESLKKAAGNTRRTKDEARQWLVGEIDKAVDAAGPASDAKLDALKKAVKQYDKERIMVTPQRQQALAEAVRKASDEIGFVTFDVPGDGKFKVLNTPEKLQEFRKKVLKSPGFKGLALGADKSSEPQTQPAKAAAQAIAQPAEKDVASLPGEAPSDGRPDNWRANMVAATKVARGLGIDVRKYRRTADLVRAIDEADAKARGEVEKPIQQQTKTDEPLSVGPAPGSAEPVTVKDGTVFIGKYEALNYETGEPVTVPKGSTRADVVKALQDAGALTSRDRAFNVAGDKGKQVMFSRSASTKAAYEARIDALFAGEKAAGPNAGATVLDRSDVLAMLGFGDGPLRLAEGKVLRGQGNHPRMTAEQWKKMPEWLDHPAAVFNSDTVPGALVLIAPETVDGSTVRMTIEPGKDGGSDVHILTNAYDAPGFTPFDRWFREGLAYLVDQKTFPAVLGDSGLRLSSSTWQNKPGMRKILTEKNLAGYRHANDARRSFADQQAATATKSGESTSTIAAAIRRAYGSLLDKLQAKGLVTLVQTEDEAVEAAAKARAAKTGQPVEQARATLRASVKNSVADQTQTEAFKRWFKNSKVVDAEGKPLVVYHGTHGERTVFEPYWKQLERDAMPHELKDNGSIAQIYRLAKEEPEMHFFAAESGTAESYGPDVVEAYLKIDNMVGSPDMDRDEAIQLMLDQDADGAIFSDTTSSGGYGGVAYAVRRSSQIKSATGNRGTFDPADPDIRRSADGAIQGFFDPQTGQSFLVADNLTAEAAPGVLMHEVGIHMTADGSMKALFNRAAMMLKMQRGNPFMKAVQARMDAAGENSGEEAAAYIAEAYENDRANAPASVQRWLADLLAAVKAWMFKKGIMGADRLTVADIAAVARANARSMARDGGATDGQGFGPAFSGGPATEVRNPVLFSFAGQQAATADKLALATAQERLAAGEDAETVRQETGWFKGVDGKWRYEISDDAAIPKGTGTFGEVIMRWYHAGVERTGNPAYKTTVGDILRHPKLFAAYPELANIEVQMAPAHVRTKGRVMRTVINGRVDETVIQIKEHLPSAEWSSVLLHELQHGIQYIEGFATGGTPSDFAKDLPDGSYDNGFDTYKRTAGEVEARNTQARQKLTAEQRRATAPGSTADVADADVIVVFNGKEAAHAPAPANGAMSSELARQILALQPKPATKESVQAAVRQLVGIGMLPNRLGRVVVATSSEIKQDWEPIIGKTGMEASGEAGQVQGFYDPKTKTVFLIADHINAGDELGVVAHELMHKHGQAVLGEEGWNTLHSVISGWAKAEAGSMERRVYAEAAARVRQSRPSDADVGEYSSQELFPYAVQVALELGVKPNAFSRPGTVAKWLAQVKLALRDVWKKVTGTARGEATFKSQDLVNLAFGIAQRENPAHAGELDGALTDDGNRLDDAKVRDRGDVRFSRSVAATAVAQRVGDVLQSMTVTNLSQQAGFKAADYRSLGLQLLGRRQLVDVYGSMLPELRTYSELMARMDADKNEAGASADQLAKEWADLPDERPLAELMHDATLAQMDPAKAFVTGDNRLKYGELRRRFEALSPAARAIYARARDTYSRHMRDVRTAIKERIERAEMSSERRAALLKRLDDEFFGHIKGVYFPLARFGQYVVVVKNADGTVESVSRAETMAEADATRGQLLAAFPSSKGFTVGKVLKARDFVAERDSVGRGFMEQLYGVLDKQGMEPKQRAELEDALGQLYLSSLPDLSWARHGIHRKGTPGFSQDARRAFAQNVFHGASYLAKLRYGDQLQDQLGEMQRRVDAGAADSAFDSVKAQQVVDEMSKRHDAAMNPKTNSISTALTSFGFMFHLGLSPASAMVNLTQTALVAYPIMGARWGFKKASAALLQASREAARGRNDIVGSLNADEKAAFKEAVRAGVVDVTMAHDLAGIAQGEDQNVSYKLRPVMRAASFLFHHAEKFNRQVTFVAAYRLAREAGADRKEAYQQAVQTTYDGHFDYSSNNRPRVMQGNVARVLLLFKQYGQNMVYTFARSAQQSLQGATPEARAQARKTLAGLLTTHAMAAGVLGLPMVTTLLAAASMLGGDDDEPWDAEVALRNLLADTFGHKPAEVLAHGLSRLTPWDISGRVGLDKLIFPDVQEGLEGQRLAESAMAAALGPVAGIGINALKGLQEMGEGRYQRGLETMAPSVLRGLLKALRYETEGVKDKTGIVVQDEVDAAALWGQAAGFSPSSVRNAYEGKSAVVGHDRALQARRSALMERFAMAAMAEDEEGKAEAREAIQRFNEKNPGRRILPMQLARSIAVRHKRIREAREGGCLPVKRRDAMEQGRFAVGA